MSKDERTEVQITVHEATYNLLRRLGLTTIFGNPEAISTPESRIRASSGRPGRRDGPGTQTARLSMTFL